MQYIDGYIVGQVCRWQETAIVLDLPSRPTSVRFNNARSTGMGMYISVHTQLCVLPNFFTFTKVFTPRENVILETNSNS